MGYMQPPECIKIIDREGKREFFIKHWRRTPEEYFSEYAHLIEEGICHGILADIGIKE